MGFKDDFLLHLQEQTEEAEKRGLEEGREEGEQIGRHEANCQMALKLLVKGMTAIDIADITGLSVDEINALR